MPQPIRYSDIAIDLSTRHQGTSVVAGSPSTNAETVIATLTLANFNDIQVVSGIRLHGWCAFTVGTSGVAATLQIKQTSTSGTSVQSSGATTVVATNLLEMSCLGFDAGAGVPVYVLTLTIGSGGATSTVSKLHFSATII